MESIGSNPVAPGTSHLEEESKLSVEQILTRSTIECMQTIVRRNHQAMAEAVAKPSGLSKGLFYANEYMQALEQIVAATRDDTTRENAHKLAKQTLAVYTKKGNFYHGLAPDFFDMRKEPLSLTGTAIHEYRLNDKQTPSAAIDAMVEGTAKPMFIDCSMACQLATLKALKDLFKDDKFNRLFDFKGPAPLAFTHSQAMGPPLKQLFVFTLAKTHKIRAGEWGDFHGVKSYGDKHINGEAGAFNVICLNDQEPKTYLGLGLDPEGVTHDQLVDTFVEEYNKPPIDYDLLSEDLQQKLFQQPHVIERRKTAASFRKRTITKKDAVKKELCGAANEVMYFNIKRIEMLYAASAEEGRKLLAQWVKEPLVIKK